MNGLPGLEAKGMLSPGGDENLATARPMPARAVKLEHFRLHGQVRSLHAGSDQPKDDRLHEMELLEAAQRQRAELEAERRELEIRHAELYRVEEELRSDAARVASDNLS